MKEWYNKLEPRERKLLIVGAVALTVAFIYFILWKPFVKKVERLEKTTVEQQSLVEWMKTTALEVKQLRRASRPAAAMNKGQSLLGVIDRTTKTRKLAQSVKRVKPDGDTKARVWLENASFNTIVLWVEELQTRQGVSVVNAVIDKTKEPGRVDARLVFEGAS